MSIKAILFDMDGVLIDAKQWHYAAFNQALNTVGIHISQQDHIKKFDGLPTRKKLEILSMEGKLPYDLHDYLNAMKQQYTMEIIKTECKPCAIHQLALSTLQTMGYYLALCSNSVRHTVDMMIQRAKLDKYLDLTLSNEDVHKSKPDPEIYLKAMQHFDLKPTECLIIEDNEHGIQAAQASGGHLLIVEHTEHTNLKNILGRIHAITSQETT